ncbi:MAG: hypothetical protein ACC662_08845, partial [Planctomycetota bacterium]
RFLAVTNRVDYVADYGVEVAQGSNISDPVVDHLDEGLVVDAVAYPLLDGKRVLLEAYVQLCRLAEMRRVEFGVDEECFNRPFRSAARFSAGVIELPTCRHADAHVSAIVPSGGDVRLPVVARGRRLELRFQVELLSAAGPDSVLDVGALTAPAFPLYAGEPDDVPDQAYLATLRLRPGGKGRFPGLPPLGTPEEVVDLVQMGVEPARWEDDVEQARLDVLGGGRLLAFTKPGLLASVRGFLAAREAEVLRPVVLEVAVHSVRGDVASGPGRALDPEVSTLLTSARLPTLDGRWASLRLGTTRNYLADYAVEVAQEARIADPIPGQSFGGLIANVRPHLPLEGRTVRVDLDLLLSEDGLAEKPFDAKVQYMGPIEQVRARQTRLRTTVGVPRGGTTLLDAGPDPSTPDARLVVAISVTAP